MSLLVFLCSLTILASIFLTQLHYQSPHILSKASDSGLANSFIEGFEKINHEYRECIAQHDDGNIEADIACISIREEKAEAMKELMQKQKEIVMGGLEEYHYEYRDEHAGDYQYQHEYRAEHKDDYKIY